MAIADKITKLATDLNNAYEALREKGASIPSAKNTSNLVATISSVSGGGMDPRNTIKASLELQKTKFAPFGYSSSIAYYHNARSLIFTGAYDTPQFSPDIWMIASNAIINNFANENRYTMVDIDTCEIVYDNTFTTSDTTKTLPYVRCKIAKNNGRDGELLPDAVEEDAYFCLFYSDISTRWGFGWLKNDFKTPYTFINDTNYYRLRMCHTMMLAEYPVTNNGQIPCAETISKIDFGGNANFVGAYYPQSIYDMYDVERIAYEQDLWGSYNSTNTDAQGQFYYDRNFAGTVNYGDGMYDNTFYSSVNFNLPRNIYEEIQRGRYEVYRVNINGFTLRVTGSGARAVVISAGDFNPIADIKMIDKFSNN